MTDPVVLETRRHMLAHTARMQFVLRQTPEHPRKDEYARQFRIYRGRWAELTPDEQSEAHHSMINASDVPDLTPAHITAAVAELEA